MTAPAARTTLLMGASAVALYVASWAVAGLLYDGYDPLRQAISELFAAGAPVVPSRLVRAGLAISGLALIAFGPALHRLLPGSGRMGPALVTASGVLTLGVLAFPCTAGCPGAGTTLTDTLHTVTAGGGYAALVTAPLLVARRVRGVAPAFARWSVLLGGIALAGFALHAAGLAAGFEGLAQRVFNTTADAWYVVAAVWTPQLAHDTDPHGD